MSEFSSSNEELLMDAPNNDKSFKNVKEIKSSDGSFAIRDGRLEMRDTAGNIVILLDPNG